MATQSLFSVKAAIKIAVIHFALTYVFALLAFFTAMGSFTKSVTDEMAFWNMVMWVWTPLARAAFDHAKDNLDIVRLLAISWSCIVGVAAGFFRKNFRFKGDPGWDEK
ncbi:hypothetical protein EI77_03364 [Prosthecobacter fusiformis]|uniref:Uncharacterized protein n=1 Tax=Prosthecobacter fusiformis TaxID=48464 RepID=A0A4V3FEI8_9BACT|nr:hypothetical protein [Prosthecobacter fusiformis]TDU67163.1 hypothetical protein EI77_03364 [Prosthecobacter fusiformis]